MKIHKCLKVYESVNYSRIYQFNRCNILLNYACSNNDLKICKNMNNISIFHLQSLFYTIKHDSFINVKITKNTTFKQCSPYLINKLNNYCNEKLNETKMDIIRYTDYVQKLKCNIRTYDTYDTCDIFEQKILLEKLNYMCSMYETSLEQLCILKLNLLTLKNAIESTEIFENNMFSNINKCNEIENNLNVNNNNNNTYITCITATTIANNLTNIETANNLVIPIANVVTNNINDIPDINMYNLVDVTSTNNANIPVAQVMP